MLPSLGALSLGPSAPVVRTGEFITLSREEADELNESREVEPVSHEEYVPSRELPDGADYFRVRFKYQKPDQTYDYTVYDAETLWRWVKDRYTLPHNREPIWQEDWRALHERYDPQGNVSQRVAQLPNLEDPVLVYEGSGDQRRLVRIEHPDGVVTFYDGPSEQERLVRARLPSGTLAFYYGPREEERLVRMEHSSGSVTLYNGPKGEERMVRGNEPNGKVLYYKGARGEERVVRAMRKDGVMEFLEGPKDEGRVVRTVHPDGEARFYDGPKGKERVIRRLLSNGEVRFYEWIYEDPPRLGFRDGEMRLVRTVHPDGRVVMGRV